MPPESGPLLLRDAEKARALVQRMTGAPNLPPRADAVLKLAEVLSAEFLAADDQGPEVQALGFWLRPAAIEGLWQKFHDRMAAQVMPAPRGLVVHFPPANVATFFVYGWFLSLLTGNRNIVRLSRRSGAITAWLVVRIQVAVAHIGDPHLSTNTAFVGYDPDPDITESLCAQADARMIWGGDAAVSTIRSVEMPPQSVDLVFPDRVSWAVMDAMAYLAQPDVLQTRLAERFGNDVFGFNQQACASPRLLVWRGAPEDAAAAGTALFARLATFEADHGPDPGLAMHRTEAAYQALRTLPVSALHWHGPLAVMHLTAPVPVADLPGPGGGLLFTLTVQDLTALVPIVGRRDQTVTHFGVSQADLRSFSAALNGRGVDRFVPLGQALAFDAMWDGEDILARLTRLISVQGGI